MNEQTNQTPIRKEESAFVRELKSMIRTCLTVLAIVLPIRIFIAQPFVVSGSSMDPTFHDGQYLVIDQVSYRFNDPQRGDVIVFRYPNDPSKFFIKRVIGLPGEEVAIIDGKAHIKNDAGEIIFEDDFVVNKSFDTQAPRKLEAGEYFVMGDNRSASSDSRVWGPLPEEFITGKALVRVLPISSFGFHPGSIVQLQND